MKTFNHSSIDEMVYGHKQAKKVLKVLLKRSQDRYYAKCVKGLSEYQDTLKVLLVGPSGTGKTHLIQSLSKLHNFPLICLDATQLMPTGNKDGVNTQQLIKLINDTANEYTKQPEYFNPEGVINQMVIFVDEFDKLGTSFDSSGNWNKHVQANFLTLIDNKEEFSGISWIFAGAFTDIYENKGKEKSIGFFPEEKKESTKEITDEEILKAGIVPEMLGRISLIVQLDTFDKDDYCKILVERLLPNYSNLHDIDVDAIVEKALNSGQGIRSLTRQLEMLSIDADFDDVDEISALARYL